MTDRLTNPFRCLRIPGTDPVFKIWDGRTGEWSTKTYIMDAGLRQGKADAARLNRLWQEERRRQALVGEEGKP